MASATGSAGRRRWWGDARAATEAPGSTLAFLRQRRRWFGGFLQTQYWYRDMVGARAYGRLGLLMLPVKAADTWQPIYGLTAFALLVAGLLRGRVGLVAAASGAIGVKLVVDIAFILWSIHLYRRWTAPAVRVGYGAGLLAALLEPFSFQLMRHLGAALGWGMVLTGAAPGGGNAALGSAPCRRPPAARVRRASSGRRPARYASVMMPLDSAGRVGIAQAGNGHARTPAAIRTGDWNAAGFHPRRERDRVAPRSPHR